ncbi:hypothetical protein [Asticcacaulis taihuensis]|uniref:hypothetical protein n=1 Tax=Asticcacaulis taihuensis TaxID=260084 RepID=UPI0026EF2B10|nr:hypothetical protein [Asticcacaulis taihuensis]
MSDPNDNDTDNASNPLRGQAPAPDELKDKRPEGENTNASQHFDADPAWKERPGQYPAAKMGLLNPDLPGAGKTK